jgi:DNA repair and recombination protein RAD52
LEEVDGKYMCGYSAILRVTLKDGSFREDVGYGTGENTVPALALGQGQKSAISDALKRYMTG